MVIIDFHNHLIPEVYLKEYTKKFSWPNKLIASAALQSVDFERRVKVMSDNGIDINVVSAGLPGVDVFPPSEAPKIAGKMNKATSEICSKYSEKLIGLGTFSVADIDLALEEIDRCKDLGLRGVYMLSNTNGIYPDLQMFWPLYERLTKHRMPIFMHPTTPKTVDPMKDYNMVPLLAYPMDTTITICRMVFGGLLEKYPDLTIVASHLAGAVPFLVGRLDYAHNIHSKTDQPAKISKPPSYYLKQVYLDTVSLHPPAYTCSRALWGSDKIIFGTDYPFWDPQSSIEMMSNLNISDSEKLQVLSKNAARILGIN